jgi:Na+-transporting NADH:ubiquinone oxidoreductase subunit A
LVEDIDMMEKLGIYEVLEEDFALCEVVCTSKIKSQEIIRHGLDIVRREMG